MTKLDLTKPVQTRDGRPVRILCMDRKSKYPIVGLVLKKDGSETTESWLADGGYHYPACIGENDLINVPPKPVKYFVNVYRHTNGITVGNVYRHTNGITVGAANPDKPINTTADNFIKTIEFEV